MTLPIQRAIVIGAGTMGSQIAAHLANAGIRTGLLDVVPSELTEAERSAGLTLAERPVRDRIARDGLEFARAATPAAFFSPDRAGLIDIGNLEDDLEWVADADWVIEAIIENVGIKQALFERIDGLRSPDSIISSNTSGLSIHALAEGRSESFRSHFLGTHFFNPPRYLYLLELIPHADTEPAVLETMSAFARDRLGKGVVVCKDTPNFIANRLGSVIGAISLDFALRNGYSVEEVDALTGPLIGRPKTATFRLLDLVGLDVAMTVRGNLAQALPNDEAAEALNSAAVQSVSERMTAEGWLGNKSGQGFYKRVETERGPEFWSLDLSTFEYTPQVLDLPESVAKAKKAPDLHDRLWTLLRAEDRAGELVRRVLFGGLAYASNRIPEIAESPQVIDRAVRWGFQYAHGPFELWDELGVAEAHEAMIGEDFQSAPWVKDLIGSKGGSFYEMEGGRRISVYVPGEKGYVSLAPAPRQLHLAARRPLSRELPSNDSAQLVDLGEDVLGLEFLSKGNSLDDDIYHLIEEGLDLLLGRWQALVIGNDSDDFSFGANLFAVALAAQNEMWDQLEAAIQLIQSVNLRLRESPRPVVAAPAGRTLGGGVELVMHAQRAVAAAESYLGLVEVGAGVVPAGGGCKALLRRVVNPVARVQNGDVLPPLQHVFETIGTGRVARSAEEAIGLGFLTGSDRVVMNRRQLLHAARDEALHMLDSYRPPPPEQIFAAGRDRLAALRMGVFTVLEADQISEHDAKIGRALARVLTGGELSRPQWVDPWYVLDLEREAFLSLAGEPLSQARMWALLESGKPLRN